jgi:quinol-cytochrome oxidoreductase complex cytochrome b subunit
MNWIHSVNETIATETGKKIMEVFLLPGNQLQSWVYEPNQPAQRVFAWHAAA